MDEQTQVIPYIKVTNGSTRAIKDRFDGVPYTIKPGETVQLEYHIAQHFFGLPDADPETGQVPDLNAEDVRDRMYHHIIQRYGMNATKTVEAGEAAAFVAAFKFKPLIARLVVEETEGPETSAADPLTVIDNEEPAAAVIPTRSGAKARKANAERVPDQHPHAGEASPLARTGSE